ncbi:MAG: hypothetical protein AAFN77_14215 [Planctomycetota bacterium]
MENDLREMISHLRTALNARDDGPRVGNIPAGNANSNVEISVWCDVLKECDGGRFGSIDLWSSSELPSYQGQMLDVDDPDNYLIVGQILYEPVAINKATGVLHWLPTGAPSTELGNPDRFLRHFVFGSGYAEVIPDVDQEPWWQFLSSQSVA